MASWIPVVVVLLALVAAGSIVFLAWELTSKETQDALERGLGRGPDPADDERPPE